eukprot:1913800-Rhodomonas_salina.2
MACHATGTDSYRAVAMPSTFVAYRAPMAWPVVLSSSVPCYQRYCKPAPTRPRPGTRYYAPVSPYARPKQDAVLLVEALVTTTVA